MLPSDSIGCRSCLFSCVVSPLTPSCFPETCVHVRQWMTRSEWVRKRLPLKPGVKAALHYRPPGKQRELLGPYQRRKICSGSFWGSSPVMDAAYLLGSD